MATILAMTYDTDTGKFFFQKLTGTQLADNAINSLGFITDGLFAGATGLGKFADGFLSGSSALAKFGDGLFTADATGRGKFQAGFLVSSLVAGGTIGGGLIRDGDILSGKYAAGSIRTADIGAAQILSSLIGVGAIGGMHIANVNILSGKYAAQSIRTADLGLGQVVSSIIGANVIATPHIVNQGILSASIASGAIGLSHILDGAIVSGKLGRVALLSGSQLLGTIDANKQQLANLDLQYQTYQNLLFNSDFEIGDPPTGWTVWGAGFTRERSTEQVKIGTYSVKATRAGATGGVEQGIPTDYTKYQGRSMTMGSWVYTTVPGSARIYLQDGPQTTYSDYHPGDSIWRWINVSLKLAAIISGVFAGLSVENVSGAVAYFDGAMLIEGDACPAFMTRPLDYQSIISGYLASGQIGSDHIRPGSIISSLVATGSIGGMHIADLNILSGKYAAQSIHGADIDWGAITSGKYAAQSIRTTDLGLGQAISSIIGAGAIGGMHIANVNILSGKYAAQSIHGADIDWGNITSGKYASGSIRTTDIGTAQIISGLVASGVIGRSHIANASIVSGLMASGIIGRDHIGFNAIVSGRLGSGAIPDGSVSELQLAPGISIDIAESISEPTTIAAEPISGHACVLFLSGFTGKRVGMALAGDPNRMPAMGKIGPTAVVSGGAMTTNPILTYGRQTSPISGYVGSMVYVGASGQPVVTPPSTSGKLVQIIGQIMDYDGSIFLFPQPFAIQVAA